jgi:hypothetical protein
MCASCFSSADSFLLGSAGAVAVVREARQWLRLRTTTTRTGRRLARWAADADFVRTLGLDPAEVLGPPPADEDDAEVREPVLAGA